jgi:PadR family transcriptional regulator PadR
MNFIQGTLDVLILRSLSDEPRHGYDVVAWIQRVTRGEVRVVDAALYTSLHRMEGRGWLTAEWRVSEKGRRAKYYRLTALGRKHLVAGEREWSKFSTAVARLFAGG